MWPIWLGCNRANSRIPQESDMNYSFIKTKEDEIERDPRPMSCSDLRFTNDVSEVETRASGHWVIVVGL